MAEKAFKEFDHTGDRGIKLEAPTRAELFRHACLALAQLMVDTTNVRSETSRDLTVRDDSDIDLMHDLLTELLNIFISDGFIWCDAAVKEGSGLLAVKIEGEQFDAKRHTFHGEIKAVTYHNLNVDHRKDGWHATIVFDV
jgi:SHS2 domain-containing protein